MSDLALAIAVKDEWDPDRLVEGLKKSGIGPAIEVHVGCDPAHAPAVSAPKLTIHAAENASLFDLWGLAISRSKASWVAVLHADALPSPGWFEAMQDAIESEGWRDGYWGPVEPGFGPSDRRMIGYLTEYVQFHRPPASGLKEIPGSNLVLPRGRIAGQADFSKTRLLGEGLAPRYVEEAVVLYTRPIELSDYRRRRFRHGRAYAAKRMPRLSILVSLPMSLALPFVRTARILRHAWRHRHLRPAVLRWLPAIFLAETCWSVGELTGYLTRRQGDAAAID